MNIAAFLAVTALLVAQAVSEQDAAKPASPPGYGN